MSHQGSTEEDRVTFLKEAVSFAGMETCKEVFDHCEEAFFSKR